MIIVEPEKVTDYKKTKSEKEFFMIFGMFTAGKESNQSCIKLIDFLYHPKIKGLDSDNNLYESIKVIREDPDIDFYQYIKDNLEEVRNPNALGKDGKTLSPFNIIQKMAQKDTIDTELKRVKSGKYSLLGKGLISIAENGPNLTNPKIKEIESIPGISLKTSRFFLMHSYSDFKVAALDTHILKFLNHNKVKEAFNVKATPSSKIKYAILEEAFIKIFDGYKKSKSTNSFNQKLLSPYIKNKNKMTIGDFDLAVWCALKDIAENNHSYFKKNSEGKLIKKPAKKATNGPTRRK